jgi:hypothetical protein
MSNGVRRPDLRGIIIKGGKPVGGVELPYAYEEFIDQFQREYGHLGMVIKPAEQVSLDDSGHSGCRER